MLAMFISIMEHPFYKHMIGNVSSNFASMLIIKERVEVGIKKWKDCTRPVYDGEYKRVWVPF